MSSADGPLPARWSVGSVWQSSPVANKRFANADPQRRTCVGPAKPTSQPASAIVDLNVDLTASSAAHLISPADKRRWTGRAKIAARMLRLWHPASIWNAYRSIDLVRKNDFRYFRFLDSSLFTGRKSRKQKKHSDKKGSTQGRMHSP